MVPMVHQAGSANVCLITTFSSISYSLYYYCDLEVIVIVFVSQIRAYMQILEIKILLNFRTIFPSLFVFMATEWQIQNFVFMAKMLLYGAVAVSFLLWPYTIFYIRDHAADGTIN